MNRLFLLFFFSLASYSISAQSAKAFVKAGDKALAQGAHHAAMEYYAAALGKKPKSTAIQFKYAQSAQRFYAFEIAEEYYGKVLTAKDASTFPEAAFLLGEVYKAQGKYEQAITQYEAYKRSGPSADSKKATSKIEEAKWAMEQVAQAKEVTISALNKRVNTGFSEFAPFVKGDTLYYSSYRYDFPNDDHDPPRKLSKVLRSIKGSKGRPVKGKINGKSDFSAHGTFSLDDQRFYFTRCTYVTDSRLTCEIYVSEKDRRKRWGKAKKLPSPINESGSTSTHPQIVKWGDKEVLLFVSDRSGGVGQLDIYSVAVPEKGKWDTPGNLEGVNTSGNDITPFYHAETQMLYFSTDGRRSLGGYDVYQAQFTGKDFEEIQNLGAPVNTSYNDLYYWLGSDTLTGYLASNRLGSMYLVEDNKVCCNDIYKFRYIPEEAPEEPEPIDSLTMVDIDPEPEPLETTREPDPVPPPLPSKLEDFLPLALYFDNDEPDKRTRKTTTRKTYEQTYLDYYPLKSTYQEAFADPLPELEQAGAQADVDYFFENKVRKGYEFLQLFSNILLQRLEEGETVEIFVKGFTSPRAKGDYNLNLGKRRVSSVRNHFSTYQEGIFQSYIQSGQLKITERSFGETTASATISDDLDDRRNSVYNPLAAEERRVEIVEIKRGTNQE